MIALEKVGAAAGRFALRDVSFAVPAGGYAVLLGPAGAGKTTLLETIAGLVPQTAGTLRLAGRDAGALPPEHRGLAIVYQHAYLFPHLPVAANVAYGARDPGAAAAALALLEAAELAARPLARLSGGERQLVALARALARGAPILLLDEPYGALDPGRRVAVRRAVRDAVAARGTTVLHVTHDLDEAVELGTQAVVLLDGRVAQAAPPARLRAAPASVAVARFLALENVLAGVADGAGRRLRMRDAALAPCAAVPVPGARWATIPEEEVCLAAGPEALPAGNRWAGTVVERMGAGPLVRVRVAVEGATLVAALGAREAAALVLAPGARVVVGIPPAAVHLLER